MKIHLKPLQKPKKLNMPLKLLPLQRNKRPLEKLLISSKKLKTQRRLLKLPRPKKRQMLKRPLKMLLEKHWKPS